MKKCANSLGIGSRTNIYSRHGVRDDRIGEDMTTEDLFTGDPP